MDIVKVLVLGGCVGLGTMGCAADTGDSEEFSEAQDSLIVGRAMRIRGQSGLCLDGYDNNGANANPYLWTCTTGNNYQLWKATGPQGQQQICNVGNGRCLDGFGNASAGRILTYTFTSQPANPYQKWNAPVSQNMGTLQYPFYLGQGKIANVGTGFCLAPKTWTSGSPMYTVPCAGGASWNIF